MIDFASVCVNFWEIEVVVGEGGVGIGGDMERMGVSSLSRERAAAGGWTTGILVSTTSSFFLTIAGITLGGFFFLVLRESIGATWTCSTGGRVDTVLADGLESRCFFCD